MLAGTYLKQCSIRSYLFVSGGMLTILLIEDNGPFRRDIAAELRRRGYGLIEAANGSEATSLAFAAGGIDFLLLECYLPDVNGCELAATLRELFGQKLPAMFISAPDKPEFELFGDASPREIADAVADILPPGTAQR